MTKTGQLVLEISMFESVSTCIEELFGAQEHVTPKWLIQSGRNSTRPRFYA